MRGAPAELTNRYHRGCHAERTHPTLPRWRAHATAPLLSSEPPKGADGILAPHGFDEPVALYEVRPQS